jgi:phage-related protein
VIYVASVVEAIYVLHVFEKKSRKTSTRDVKVAKARFKILRRSRARV